MSEKKPYLQQDAQPIISLNGLAKQYGGAMAVSGLNLEIYPGEIFGLLGPNGAGKTTTILMMLGLTEMTAGSARICGLDPVREALEVKRRVGYLPDDVGFYEERTALENLIYTARLNGASRDEARARALGLLEKVRLSDSADARVATFSKGMRQRLGLADVLIKNPRIIILDEPTLGIDPEGVRELLGMIRELSRSQGLTVLLSSHQLHQVQRICDRVGLFVGGRLIAAGNMRQLAEQLDEDHTVAVELAVSGAGDGFTGALSAIDGVTQVLPVGAQAADAPELKRYTVVCTSDISFRIARCAVEQNARLHALQCRQYGLDDIYHRYFERKGAQA